MNRKCWSVLLLILVCACGCAKVFMCNRNDLEVAIFIPAEEEELSFDFLLRTNDCREIEVFTLPIREVTFRSVSFRPANPPVPVVDECSIILFPGDTVVVTWNGFNLVCERVPQ